MIKFREEECNHNPNEMNEQVDDDYYAGYYDTTSGYRVTNFRLNTAFDSITIEDSKSLNKEH